jgi:hypothetical protein
MEVRRQELERRPYLAGGVAFDVSLDALLFRVG